MPQAEQHNAAPNHRDTAARLALLAAHSSDELETRITGRSQSLLAQDMETHRQAMKEAIAGARVLVVGGGGSIGSATTLILSTLNPACLHVVDVNENYLAELARRLRNAPHNSSDLDFATFPLDFGSPLTSRLLAEQKRYDIVLNFAALKHVRSEKDIFSVLQMIDTNVVKQGRFQRWVVEHGGCGRYFAVSTDKAANPSSLMGASKRLMEDVLFAWPAGADVSVSSARFANVAFSNGSLLQSFLQRLALGQPLSVPRNTRRYFVSQKEAGQLCALAATVASRDHIVFPRLEPEKELHLLEQVAVDVLDYHGYEPVVFEDENEAKEAVAHLGPEGRWPLLLTPLDTSGEKPFEEFLGEGEASTEIGFNALLGIRHLPSRAFETHLFEKLERLVGSLELHRKSEIIGLIAEAIPTFKHVETGRSLDQRM